MLATVSCSAFIAALIVPITSVYPQSEDQGQQNFLANCAQCHGAGAKGDGPRSAELHIKPADLTLLAKKNNGVFDAGAIYQAIDGREAASRPHLSADMPIWGCRHQGAAPVKRRVPKHYRPPPLVAPRVVEKWDNTSTWQSFLDLSCDSDQAIQDRILSIIGYLSRIQAP